MTLRAFRVELSEANGFVSRLHRHHGPTVSHRFSLGVGDSELRGVAICGRPVSCGIDNHLVLEVNRVCTDGTRNACSWLYSHAAQVAAIMGFSAVITYTLAAEDGASLRACGWWSELLSPNPSPWSWARRERKLTKGQGLGQKTRWLWLTGCDAPPTSALMPSVSLQLELVQ